MLVAGAGPRDGEPAAELLEAQMRAAEPAHPAAHGEILVEHGDLARARLRIGHQLAQDLDHDRLALAPAPVGISGSGSACGAGR